MTGPAPCSLPAAGGLPPPPWPVTSCCGSSCWHACAPSSLSQAQLPWQTSLAAFAVIRLLTAIPITPGGLGITELGLIGILAGSAGHEASAQVTAAVLMYRAVTYLPPICLPSRSALSPA